MFDFIKRLFKIEEKVKATLPVVIPAAVTETVVITEVALAEIKKKPATVTAVKTTPVAKAKGITPAKEKPVVNNVVPLVQPAVEKVVKPKKPAKPKKVVVNEDIKLSVVTPTKPKGRPKKTPAK
jgi:hypothetical protein